MRGSIEDHPVQAARWLAEAVESGNPLAALPPEIAPADLEEAGEVALAVLEALGLTACGVRLLHRPGAAPLVGPMVEGRLLAQGATVPLAALRHPAVTAAALGVLAAPLEPGEATPPVFARLHPALDIAASRYSAPTSDELALTADLGRLGLLVAGKAKPLPPGWLRVALAPPGSRPRGIEIDLAAAFAEAAAAARDWGGLPAGALLVVAGLTPPQPPEGRLRARLGALGGAEALFA